MTLQFVIHATVDGKQHAIEQFIQIAVEPPFEGWPNTIVGQFGRDVDPAVLRIGPLNPTYFAPAEGGDLEPGSYQWELRDSDLAPVEATLVEDQSELWVEVAGPNDAALLEDYMMVFSSTTDLTITQRLFVPVVTSYLEDVLK